MSGADVSRVAVAALVVASAKSGGGYRLRVELHLIDQVNASGVGASAQQYKPTSGRSLAATWGPP